MYTVYPISGPTSSVWHETSRQTQTWVSNVTHPIYLYNPLGKWWFSPFNCHLDASKNGRSFIWKTSFGVCFDGICHLKFLQLHCLIRIFHDPNWGSKSPSSFPKSWLLFLNSIKYSCLKSRLGDIGEIRSFSGETVCLIIPKPQSFKYSQEGTPK